MQAKDARMKVTTEALNNPKMLKLYSWENNFVRRIERKRALEMIQLKRQGRAISLLYACIYFWPNLLPVVVFSTYILLGNYLTLDVAIASLILFGKLRSPMTELPWFIKTFLEFQISNRRIAKFLFCDEVQQNIHKRLPGSFGKDLDVISIKGNFSWGFKEKTSKPKKGPEPKKDKKAKGKGKEEEKKEETKPKQIKTLLTLKDIDLKVRKGEFVCIIGDVGAGKTSLLKSIIGDLIYIADEEIGNWGGEDVTL